MSEDKNIQTLKFNEHIRKRPGMYIGRVNHKGYIDTLKKLITKLIKYSDCTTVCITFQNQVEGEITFKNITRSIRANISIIDSEGEYDSIDLPILNSLSKNMDLFFDLKTEYNQNFERGKSISDIPKSEIKCNELKIKYALDKLIWGEDFKWNLNYLSYELREFCYLNPNVKFEISEVQEKYSNTNSYQYRNGLNDRLEIEILNGVGTYYFRHHLKHQTENYSLEAAFAFRQYSVDQNFIRTYVNNEVTPENGTHLDGLLKGLTYGVMKHFQAEGLVDKYKISEKGMREGLVCLISIKMESAVFSGCVKNKLANSEIIEPISNYVSEELFKSITSDKESTKKLIDKFKIELE